MPNTLSTKVVWYTERSNLMNTTISRDAGDKSKGPRLQKLRAVELLFRAVENNGASHIYVATEAEGDVSLHVASPTGSNMYVEENKNYHEDHNFTFASKQVLNTIVSFLDSWVKWQLGSTVEFGFYCPNMIGKEKKTKRSEALKIKWPSVPVLKILQSLKPDDKFNDSLVNDLSKLVKDEYEKQYKDKSSNGCLDVLNEWKTDEWRIFIRKIKWRFGQLDDIELKNEVLSLIKNSKHYCQQHSGKEERIVAMALEMLDERQALQEPTERFVYSSDIENLFLKAVSSGDVVLPDPAWEMWEGLPSPSDTRNIESKIKAVATSMSKLQIGKWSRKAASGFNTTKKFGTDKSILALKYRIFTACSDRWDEFLETYEGKPPTRRELSKWISQMAGHCKDVVTDLEIDHSYSVSNSTFVEELIWVLIDECYLSFDEEPAA